MTPEEIAEQQIDERDIEAAEAEAAEREAAEEREMEEEEARLEEERQAEHAQRERLLIRANTPPPEQEIFGGVAPAQPEVTPQAVHAPNTILGVAVPADPVPEAPPEVIGVATPVAAVAVPAVDETVVPAPVVDPEDDQSAVYAVCQASITRELLQKLTIRIVSETTLNDSTDPLAESIPVWLITKAGVGKLTRHGFLAPVIAPTGLHAIFFVQLVNPDMSPARAGLDPVDIKTFQFVSWSGRGGVVQKDRFKQLVITELQAHLGKHIKIVDSGNHVSVPIPRGSTTLQLVIWGSPTPGSYRVPTSMWGIVPACQDSGSISLWAEGEPIVTAEGDEVGAYDDSNIYLYWDAVDRGTEPEFSILSKVFQAVLTGLADDPAAKTAKVRERYVAACTGRIKTRERELSTVLKGLQQTVRESQEIIVEKLREAKAAELELQGLTLGVDALQVQLAGEFDRITKMAKVRSVGWRGTNFTVNTDVLYCRNPQTKAMHEIGAFRLVFDMRTSLVLFFNETRKVNAYRDAMNGPHLFPDGRACLGNMDNIIPKLIAGYEWGQAVVVALTFIESVNMDDPAGKYIGLWPVREIPKPVVTAVAATPVAAPAAV